MNKFASALVGTLITTAIYCALVTAAFGSHLRQPDASMVETIEAQLGWHFPEGVTEWKLRTYMRRGRHWIVRAAPRNSRCIGDRELLLDIQGPNEDIVAVQYRDRIILPYSGRNTRVWLPYFDVRPPWPCY